MNKRMKKKKAKQRQKREETFYELCRLLVINKLLMDMQWNPYYGEHRSLWQDDNFGCSGHRKF